MKLAESTRAANIRHARVLLAQARVRRHQSFHAVLLLWAANARRRASQQFKTAQTALF